MRRHAIVTCMCALALGWSAPGYAQATTDPYATSFRAGYDFFSHAFEESSAVGVNFEVARMLRELSNGGGWGVSGGAEFEKFASATLKEFGIYFAYQGKASGQKEMKPFARVGIGAASDSGATDMMIDFRGGVDLKLTPDAKFKLSLMLGIKRVLAEFYGFNVFRLNAGIVIPLNK